MFSRWCAMHWPAASHVNFDLHMHLCSLEKPPTDAQDAYGPGAGHDRRPCLCLSSSAQEGMHPARG